MRALSFNRTREEPRSIAFPRGGAALFMFVSLLFGCAAMPGGQAYWDAKVRQMCEQDGGVKIFERVPISPAELQRMGKVGDYASIPPRFASKPTDVLFWDETITVVREANPRVSRSEQLVKRKSDEKIVAQVIRYSRVGGDVMPIGHPSHFGCPDEGEILAARQKVFMRVEPQ